MSLRRELVPSRLPGPESVPRFHSDRTVGGDRILALLASLLLPALGKAREKAWAAGCLSNLRQVSLARVLYASDYEDYLVLLYMNGVTPPGDWWPSTDGTWWADSLRLCVHTTNVVVFPSVPSGSGIAMNHPDIGAWCGWPAKLSAIKHPTDSVPYADSGLIANPTERNRDWWVEKKDSQSLYYRTPANTGYYDDDPERPVNRHNLRCNTGFADGHRAAIRVSLIGLQYYPG